MHSGKLSLIAALLFTLPAIAQPTAAESSTPTIKVFSRETIVDVIVTDVKGNPIRGLKKSDFSIEEDGKSQPVRGFGEFERGFTAERPSDYNSEVHSNLMASPATGPVNILLIDGLHLNFFGSQRALAAVSVYADHMPSGTQLAVYWLGASGLHLLQGFTTDPELIQHAVAVTRTDIGSNLDCYETDKLTIEALNQIAAYVAGVKGRKNLMWLSLSVPLYLLRDGGYGWGTASACNDNALAPRAFGVKHDGASLFTGPDGNETPGIDMTLVHRLMDTYELFTNEQIAVSPVSPGGLPSGLGTGQNLLLANAVAEQSGGTAIYNTNGIAAGIAKVIDLGSHYYTVSYVPPRRKDDGHYHQITIHVARPGVRLTYRHGYNAEQPRQPREYAGPALIKAALEGRAPAATQLIFNASLTAAQPPPPADDGQDFDVFAGPPMPGDQPEQHPAAPAAKKDKSRKAVKQLYNLILAVPQSQISYGTAPDEAHTVKLQFAFDAYDLNGKLLGSHAQNVTLTLPPDHFARFIQAPVIFHEQITFFPGPLFLRIGVLDNISNKVGTLEIPLTIPR